MTSESTEPVASQSCLRSNAIFVLCPDTRRKRNGFPTTAMDCVDSYALGWYAAAFCVFVMLLGGFVMPTVLVGVISIAFSEANEKITTEMMNQRRVERVVATSRTWTTSNGHPIVRDQQIVELRAVFDNVNLFDSDADALEATLDIDELVPFLAYMCDKYLTPLSEKVCVTPHEFTNFLTVCITRSLFAGAHKDVWSSRHVWGRGRVLGRGAVGCLLFVIKRAITHLQSVASAVPLVCTFPKEAIRG